MTIQGRVGVAISTTGDEHRLELLGQSIAAWRAALSEMPDPVVFVTIDGDDAACQRVIEFVGYEPVRFLQVGEPHVDNPMQTREGRLGVAANKNTGIEALMDAGVEHLFLSDDDTWPLGLAALDWHAHVGARPHSMVNWGIHRMGRVRNAIEWTWPRGSMLYAHRTVIQQVGGMVEAFGPGGHEHVEWSRRIYQAGIGGTLYPSPTQYMARNGLGAARYWHAEDMPREGERRADLISRRRALTSVRRRPEDTRRIDNMMRERDRNTAFVPYTAARNRRDSATLYQNH